MRTTLDIDDDLVQVAKDLARQRHITMGQIVSELIRKAIAPASHTEWRAAIYSQTRSQKTELRACEPAAGQ